jgi:hypothetical protein
VSRCCRLSITCFWSGLFLWKFWKNRHQ